MTTRTIPAPFNVNIVLKSDGQPSKKQSIEAYTAAFDAYMAERGQDADAIKGHVDALYNSLPPNTPIRTKALRQAILARMTEGLSEAEKLTSFKRYEERLDANLSDFVVTNKNGASRATPEQVQAARAAKEEAKAKREAAKSSAPTA
jgi:hypothetical protein